MRSDISRLSKCAIAPNTWNTSLPAAEVMSISSFKADQIDLLFFQRVDDLEEFPERAPEAIKTDDGERVAGPGIVEQRSEARPVEGPSGDNITGCPGCMPDPGLLPFTSLLGWEHIILMGNFDWHSGAAERKIARRLYLSLSRKLAA